MLLTHKQNWNFSKIATWCAVALGALFAFVVITASAMASSEELEVPEGSRLITLYDRGVEHSFVTEAATIGQALDDVDIELDPRDSIEPGLDEEIIASEYTINIYRARPLVVVDGIERHKVVTAAQTVEHIAKAADVELHDEDIAEFTRSESMLIDGAAMNVEITRATTFEFTHYGETFEARTQANTVEEMLEEKDIELGENDRLNVELGDLIREGMKINLWREGRQTITLNEEVDFDTEQIQDADREVGFREVRTEGRPGERTVTYEVVIRNGEEVERKEINSVTRRAAVNEVVVVGAKFNYTGGPLNDEQMNFLGNCESGMTPTTNSGNGFYGAFQFMPATWRSAAPAPYNQQLPHEVPLDVQKQAVQNLLSGSNIFNQFPSCANQMRAQGIL